MLKLAQDNALIIQGYMEMRKEYDLSSTQGSYTGDLTMQEISTRGFMLNPNSSKNRDYLIRCQLKTIQVS
jgi:hypothetical protein